MLISAMMRDKETEKMCQRLAPRVRCVVCTQPNIPRAMPAEELARAFEAQGLRAYARTHVRDALEEALQFIMILSRLMQTKRSNP